jgi:hypothetical protein
VVAGRPEPEVAKKRSVSKKAPGQSDLGDVLTALELDLVQMRTEPAGGVSTGPAKQSTATPNHTPDTGSSRERAREKKREKGPAPEPREKGPAAVQDEWGFFDPEQCGFSALLTKLDEISEDEKRSSKKRA